MSLAYLSGTEIPIGSVASNQKNCPLQGTASANGATYNMQNTISMTYTVNIPTTANPVTPYLVSFSNIPPIFFTKVTLSGIEAPLTTGGAATNFGSLYATCTKTAGGALSLIVNSNSGVVAIDGLQINLISV